MIIDFLAADCVMPGVHPARNARKIFSALRNSVFLLVLLLISGSCVLAQVNVVTQHNDNARTGQNISETILTPANVNSTQFGKLFSVPTDGQIYAQPLYVAGVAIPGKGTHNVVYVATEADSVYAFDADTSGPALWHASLVDSAHGAGAGETPLTTSSTTGCADLQPLIGITATPVIDLPSKTIYVEAKSVVNTNSTYIHRLHALDITTGAEKASSPVVITATVTGNGSGSSGGHITFDPLYQHARPGLLLFNGTVFIGYASHCDQGPYHGWLFAYDHTTLQQKAVYNSTANGGLGGFWNSGTGIAADSAGNMYLASGNGSFSQSAPLSLGDTIMKVVFNGSSFTVSDYFTPYNQNSLNGNDADVGSGGVTLLPDQAGAHPHLLVQAGKEGRIYIVDRDAMTTSPLHYCNGCSSDPEIFQESASGQIGGLFSAAAYWNNTTYWFANSLKAIPLSAGKLNFTGETSSSTSYGFPGATPSISANGNSNGIVWSINTGAYGSPGPAVLHAHNATNVTQELYNSTQAANQRDKAGNAVKFAVPTISNGKVYVGASSELDVYGLLGTPATATPAISPAAGTYSNSVSVSISDSTAGATIYYTTNGSTPTTSSTKYSSAFTLTATATVKAIATASGHSNSAVASNTYTISGSKTPIVYQTESLPAVSSGPTHRVFTWGGFTNGTGTILDATKIGDNVTYTVNVSTAATYDVKVGVKKYNIRGIMQLSVNGNNAGPAEDQYAAAEAFAEFDLGNVTINSTGNNSFKFTVVGRNASSGDYKIAFDYIKLTPQ